MVDGLKPGTKGGSKQLYMIQHRDEIIDCFKKNGAEATCLKYNMLPETLDKFLSRNDIARTFSDVERSIMLSQIAIASNRELRGQVDKLNNRVDHLSENEVEELADQVLIPWIQAALQIIKSRKTKNITPVELPSLSKVPDKNETDKT